MKRPQTIHERETLGSTSGGSERPETTRDRPETTSGIAATCSDRPEITQERIDNNFRALDKSAQDICHEYRAIAWNYASKDYYSMTDEQRKHHDYHARKQNENAYLDRTSGDKDKKLLNDDSVVYYQDRLLEEMDRRLADSSDKPYNNEKAQSFVTKIADGLEKRTGLVIEREKLMTKLAEEKAVPQNLNKEPQNEVLPNLNEESEDSDLYGPAPDIPKSNKRKFDEVSQQEASQGESSQQQVSQQEASQGESSQRQSWLRTVLNNVRDKRKEDSIIDDYADVSQEPTDYTGGDD